MVDNLPSASIEEQITFQSRSYHHVLAKMAVFQEKKKFTDIVLVAGTKRIAAHKIVLAAISDYFDAMFTSGLVETYQSIITINNIDPDALEAIILFAYTGKLLIKVSTVEDLLAAACLLNVNDIRVACCNFITKHLDPANCLGIFDFADAHGCLQLKNTAYNFAKDNFKEVCRQEEFFQLNCEQLNALLKEDDLNIKHEDEVYHALLSWLLYDHNIRKNDMYKLLPTIRISALSKASLTELVENAVSGEHGMSWPCHEDQRCLIQKPRKGTIGVLYAIGGNGTNLGASNVVEQYDPRTNKWTEITTIVTRRSQFGAVCVSGKVYVIGGKDGFVMLDQVECYDVTLNSWEILTPVVISRFALDVTSLSGPIYAVGGHDGWLPLSTVERYDPQTCQWSFVAPMNTPRSTVGVAVLNEKLYAVGGHDGTQCLNSVEAYDPHTNKWCMTARMVERRGGVVVCALRGYLYAAGGHDGSCTDLAYEFPVIDSYVPRWTTDHFSSVERYDPQTDQWCIIAAMKNCCDALGMATLGDRIYAVGGHDGQSYIDAVEVYDSITDDWMPVAALPQRRAGTHVVAVKI